MTYTAFRAGLEEQGPFKDGGLVDRVGGLEGDAVSKDPIGQDCRSPIGLRAGLEEQGPFKGGGLVDCAWGLEWAPRDPIGLQSSSPTGLRAGLGAFKDGGLVDRVGPLRGCHTEDPGEIYRGFRVPHS